MPARAETSAKGFVGVITAELHFSEVGSLKEKRMYLRRMRDRLTSRHSASFAEIGYQDLWQRTRILVAVAASDIRQLDVTLEAIDGYLHSQEWDVTRLEEEVVEIDA
ncbi:MAG: DUF503 domain-containing protein [Thermoleophilia bacterium]